jgi:hypothetical protein
MILTLLLVNIRDAEWFDTMRRTLPSPFNRLFSNKRKKHSAAPSSLGIPFKSG